jgi:hypothetical protein
MKVVGRVSPNPAGGGSPARSTPLSANQAHEGVRTVATVTVAAPLRSITNQASTTTRTGQDMTITFRSAAPDTDANPTDETHREHAPNPCITRVAFGLAASALALMSAVVHADQNPLDNGQPVVVFPRIPEPNRLRGFPDRADLPLSTETRVYFCCCLTALCDTLTHHGAPLHAR